MQVEPEKFFSMLHGFVKSFEHADRFNRESAIREEKKRQREAAAHADASEKAASGPGGNKAGSKGGAASARAGAGRCRGASGRR